MDEKGAPIANAIVTINNTVSGSKYATFTKPDGSFEIKTGWTNVFKNLDFKLRVAAINMQTREITLKDIYKNKGDTFDTVILNPFQE